MIPGPEFFTIYLLIRSLQQNAFNKCDSQAEVTQTDQLSMHCCFLKPMYTHLDILGFRSTSLICVLEFQTLLMQHCSRQLMYRHLDILGFRSTSLICVLEFQTLLMQHCSRQPARDSSNRKNIMQMCILLNNLHFTLQWNNKLQTRAVPTCPHMSPQDAKRESQQSVKDTQTAS